MSLLRDTQPSGGGSLDIAVVSLGGTWDPALPIAASRAGAVGLLDVQYLDAFEKVGPAVERLSRSARGRFGLIVHGVLGEP
ncbi:MAG: hypothetical protein HY718_04035 [Planctomycetes bacterium]|nr:hypothetical protein [Planctomycetota bacterium]